MLKPFLSLVIYLVVQVACSLILILPSAADIFPDTASMLSWTLVLSSLATIAILHCCGFVDLRHAFACVSTRAHLFTNEGSFIYKRGLVRNVLDIVSVLMLTYAFNMLTEWMELDNTMAEQFSSMAQTVPGMLAIGFIGPATEELVFRESILGGLVRRGCRPWVAAVISSLIFGAIHGNPAQIPFAFLVGMVFAVVYLRTGNILTVLICHIVNNSSAVLLMNVYADTPDIGFKDIMPQEFMYITFGIALVAGVFLLFFPLRRKMR